MELNIVKIKEDEKDERKYVQKDAIATRMRVQGLEHSDCPRVFYSRFI